MIFPILLIGATAGTGNEIAKRLLSSNQPVRIIARNREKAQKCFGETRAEIVISDLSAPNETFFRAFEGVETIIFTAAVPSGFTAERKVRAVDYGGVVAALEAAKRANFRGRFLYMTTVGLTHRTWMIRFLNWMKPNLIHWRLEAERAIRQSGFKYTIIRAGVLRNGPAGKEPIQVSLDDIPLGFATQISRADVADVLLTVKGMEAAKNQIYSIIWGGSGQSVTEQINRLAP